METVVLALLLCGHDRDGGHLTDCWRGQAEPLASYVTKEVCRVAPRPAAPVTTWRVNYQCMSLRKFNTYKVEPTWAR